MPGSLIHHLPPLVAGKDDGEHLVLPMEEASRLSTPPFSSQICCSSPHTAPVTLPPALCPYTADGTRLTASSGSDQNCWIAVPSITHPSGAEGSQQHPACPLAHPHQVLLQKHLGTAGDPTLGLYKRPALTLAGLEGRCSFCKGDSWVDQGPLCLLPGCDQLHGASLHPGLEREGPLSPPAATGQFKSALLFHVKNFLIPCGAPHSSMALNTALQPRCHRSPSQSTP